MTETAEDRSKRRFLNHFSKAIWTHQISIFYLDEQSSKQNAIEDSKRLRKMLGQDYPQPWLYRLCLLNRRFNGEFEATDVIDWDTGEVIRTKAFKSYQIEIPNHIAFHTLFTTKHFTRTAYDNFRLAAKRECDSTVRTRRREVSKEKLTKYAVIPPKNHGAQK